MNVEAGAHRTTTNFVPGGQTRFRLDVADRKAIHDLEITAELAATLNVPLPPMLHTTHHSARTDVYRRTVRLSCGECSAYRTVTIRVYHPEHVRAAKVQRAPATRTRTESPPLAPATSKAQVSPLAVGSDNPFPYLFVPPLTPPSSAEQTQVGDSS